MAPKKTSTVPAESNPSVIARSEYRRAPYFGRDDIFHTLLTLVNGEGSYAREPLLVTEEPDSFGDGHLVNPSSVLRLCVERGDFPYIHVEFDTKSTAPDEWDVWTDHVLKNEGYHKMLEGAGLIWLVRCFRDLKLNKYSPSLSTLLSRWSTDTHTFVTSWGEFTITLEDVMQLIGAEITGDVGMDKELNVEEKKIVDKLNSWLKECSIYNSGLRSPSCKANYSSWQRFIFQDVLRPQKGSSGPLNLTRGEKYDDDAHLAGYIAMLLSRFLLPGKPNDGPNRLVFPLAARLS